MRDDPIQKMSPKLQLFDTNTLFHSFSSLNISNCSLNSSISVVSAKKINDFNPQLRLQTTVVSHKKLCVIPAVVQNTDEITVKDESFGLNCIHDSAYHVGKFDASVSQSCSVEILNVEQAEGSGIFGSLPNDLNLQAKKNTGFGDCVNGRAEEGENCGAKSSPIVGNGPAVRKWHVRNGKDSGLLASKDMGNDCGYKWNHKREASSELVAKKSNSRCSMKCQHYTGRIPAILEALDGFSNLDEAFMPWKRSLNNKEMSIILKDQLRWERAMEIFEWFKRNCCRKVNAIHYNIMFWILGKSKRWVELEKLWDEMGESKIQPINSTYGTLIDVYTKDGASERAVKWLEMMIRQGIEPDKVTLGIIVQMYKKMGDLKKAHEFFITWSSGSLMEEGEANRDLIRHKISKVHSKPRPYLSLYTYNNLLDTYGKTGKVEEACRVFEQMIREGITPTTVTFNIMIHMYGKLGQFEKVFSLSKQMKDFICFPDSRTYNILIHLSAKLNDISTAAKYFKEMREASIEPDIVTYRTLLYAFSLKHMIDEAEVLILEMNGKGFEIDEFTQSALTRMYVEAGMLDNAMLWFQRFHRLGNMTSSCYSANIDAFGKHGHITEAENVFNSCQETIKLSVLEFNVMIKSYGIRRKFDKACSLFDTMETYGVMPDRCSYSTLIQALSSTGMPHLALNYVRKMQEVGLVDDCVPYCAVISSFAKLGKVEEAMEFYEEMCRYDILPDIVLYGILINIFADTGNIKEVTRCLNSMKSRNMPLNAIICSSLIKLYTDLEYLEEAQKMYQLVQSFDIGANTYSSNCMIDLYSRLSMITQAEMIFEELKRNDEANEFSYAMMLCMYKRNGMLMEAYVIAEKMKKVGILTDLLSYNTVLSLYASDGRYKDAAETFNEMVASSIKLDDHTFKTLSIILLKCGVSSEEIAELELSRQNDAQIGVENWKKMVSFVIGTSYRACNTR